MTPTLKNSSFAWARARFGRVLASLVLGSSATTVSATTYNVANQSQFTSALAAVQPGDIIQLSGTIAGGNFQTTRAGTASQPIIIRGDGTARISGSPYALYIRHNYYQLENFILQNSAKGLVIDNASHGTVDNVHCMDITQEAFKVRNQSQYWEFAFCSARRTGTSGDYGEGFYVGQAASNWIDDTPDASGYVTFFNCYTLDTVNDGWDIKEGAHDIKIVNCTADFSGPVEPATNAPRGSAGYYIRADRVQIIKSRVNSLNNGDWGYRISNQTVDGIDYGSTGNEVKQSSVTGGNVPLIFAEGGTNAKVYTDCVQGPGGFYNSGSATVTTPAPSTFTERTWSGEGGTIFGNLSSTVGSDGDPLTGTPPPTSASAPGFSPGGGTYTSAQSVTITSATSGAIIRYTTNGTNPTSTSGTVYSSPVNISATGTLKAIAYKSGLLDSSITSATYTINTSGGTVAAPSFSPGGGSYTSAQSVTITSSTSGAAIRYTTNGTTPTATTGTVYSGAVSIPATATLKAIAYKSGMTDSSVTSATYTITTGGTPSSQDISITSGNDDAKQRASNTVVTNSWRHELGYDGTEQLEIGLRFPGLNIPKNVTITAAWIQFEADKSNSGTAAFSVKAELATNAAAFSTATNNIANRTLTSASVAWSPAAWTSGDRGAAQRTTDLKTLVQAVVNQSAWASGNAIVFVVTGTGTRTAEAAESGATKAPQLHVEWQ